MRRLRVCQLTILSILAVNALFFLWPETLHAASIESLVMPGEVIQGHAKYEHACENCHEKFDRKKQRTQCLDCHKEINKDVKSRSGYHGRNPNIRTQECHNCHSEHKGRDADVIKLDKLTFDHQFTDFKLGGQHSTTACSSCHVAKKKYREAPGDCYSCHRKKNPHHPGTMGKKYTVQCQACHVDSGWRNIEYDHAKTKFPLNGKHAKTACVSCHISDRYIDTPKACIACHQADDVHAGANGTKCQDCHKTTAWKKLSFDHNKDTKFPLRERHAKLPCQSCHKDDPYRKKIKSGCVSCHSHDDKHKGNFGEKCQDCHSEASWDKQKFDHNKDTKFHLYGKHIHVDCTACHKTHVYKTKTKSDCFSCHEIDDVHKGEQGKECNKCHDENGWRKGVKFEHDITRFPLIGLHATVPCEECHLNNNYKEASIECNSCHKGDDTHKGRLGLDCQRCHTPNSWNIWRFDHNKQSEFKLDGAHTKVHCHSCHASAVDKIDSKPRSCIYCHRNQDDHNGQFGAHCDRCHTTESFKDVTMRR